METAYYVMHPTLGITAVVYAPTTEKARTTFLDWLERNNYIRRVDRQSFRKNMSTKRLEDPNVSSDVVLHYGYQEVGIPTVLGRTRSIKPTEEDLVDEIIEGVEGEPQFTPPEPVKSPESKLMPIQQVMLRGYVE